MWLIFYIRTISSMDIALQLSFLSHPQWQWHYITTLCNNGIVITQDEREGGVLFWGSVSGHWSADHENEQLLREIYILELIYWGSMRHPRVQKSRMVSDSLKIHLKILFISLVLCYKAWFTSTRDILLDI